MGRIIFNQHLHDFGGWLTDFSGESITKRAYGILVGPNNQDFPNWITGVFGYDDNRLLRFEGYVDNHNFLRCFTSGEMCFSNLRFSLRLPNLEKRTKKDIVNDNFQGLKGVLLGSFIGETKISRREILSDFFIKAVYPPEEAHSVSGGVCPWYNGGEPHPERESFGSFLKKADERGVRHPYSYITSSSFRLPK